MKKFLAMLLAAMLVIGLFAVPALAASPSPAEIEVCGNSILPYFRLNGEVVLCAQPHVLSPETGETYVPDGELADEIFAGFFIRCAEVELNWQDEVSCQVAQQAIWSLLDDSRDYRMNVVLWIGTPVALELFDALVETPSTMCNVELHWYAPVNGTYQVMVGGEFVELPADEPTPVPTEVPTPEPTEVPTPEPTEVATPEPTEVPTPEPTEVPTPEPTEVPTPEPTEVPTPEPTEEPTPTPEPTEEPTPEPPVETPEPEPEEPEPPVETPEPEPEEPEPPVETPEPEPEEPDDPIEVLPADEDDEEPPTTPGVPKTGDMGLWALGFCLIVAGGCLIPFGRRRRNDDD